MFREYANIVNEVVDEGVGRGINMFLENLNQELVTDEIYESFGGIENSLKQIFLENGFQISEDLAAEQLDENFDEKLDNILEQLKNEGIVS
jgi:hypothetical protein